MGPQGPDCTVPLDAEPGGQVGPVAVGDVGVVFEGHGDLLVGVEADAAGHQHRPVLVAAQLDVMRALEQLGVHPSLQPQLPGGGTGMGRELARAPPPRGGGSAPPPPPQAPAPETKKAEQGPSAPLLSWPGTAHARAPPSAPSQTSRS